MSSKPQRTKDGLKPSNSARSSLHFGNALPVFVGFGQQPAAQLAPTTDVPHPIGEPDADDLLRLDTHLQLAIRKTMKKDPVTKCKGLSELATLCADAPDGCRPLLPVWTKLYAQLSVDAEARVRDGCQQTHARIVASCGRQLAPFVRQLVPVWLAARFDGSCTAAANAARRSFDGAFADVTRQRKVLLFCRPELLAFVERCLFASDAGQSAYASRASPDDAEAQRLRILAGGLRCFSFYLQTIGAADDPADDGQRPEAALVADARFWPLHRHSGAAVRAAWTETLGTLLRDRPQLLAEPHRRQCVPLLLKALDDPDAGVLAFAWPAFLLAIDAIPDWLTHINVDKALLPKLWNCLQTVACRHIRQLQPHLLPLLRALHDHLIRPLCRPAVCVQFFERFAAGLRSHATTLADDRRLASAAFYACLRFALDHADAQLAVQLATVGVLQPLDWTMQPATAAAAAKLAPVLYADAAALLGHLQRTAADRAGDLLRRLADEFERCCEHSATADLPAIVRQQDAFVGRLDALAGRETTAFAVRLADRRLASAERHRLPAFVDSTVALFDQFAGLGERLTEPLACYERIAALLRHAELRQPSLVRLLLAAIVPRLSPGDRDRVLAGLLHSDDPDVRLWTLDGCLDEPLRSQLRDTALLRDPAVSRLLLASVDRLHGPDDVRLPLKCLAGGQLDADACRTAVERLIAGLPGDALPSLAVLLAELLPIVAGRPECFADGDQRLPYAIVRRMFGVCVAGTPDDRTRNVLTAGWTDALRDRSVRLDGDRLPAMLALAVGHVHAMTDGWRPDDVVRTGRLAAQLLRCADSGQLVRRTLHDGQGMRPAVRWLERVCLVRAAIGGLTVRGLDAGRACDALAVLRDAHFDGALIIGLLPVAFDAAAIVRWTYAASLIAYVRRPGGQRWSPDVDRALDAVQALCTHALRTELTDDQRRMVRDGLAERACARPGLWAFACHWFGQHIDDGASGGLAERMLDADGYASLNYVQVLAEADSLTGVDVRAVLLKAVAAAQPDDYALRCAAERARLQAFAEADGQSCDSIRPLIEPVLALLGQLFADTKRHRERFLYNETMNGASAEQTLQLAEIARLYETVVRCVPHRLRADDWDLIRLALSSWTLTIAKSLPAIDAQRPPAVDVFLAAVYRLFAAFHTFIERDGPTAAPALLATVRDEWTTLFEKDVHLVLARCYAHIAGHLPADGLACVNALSECAQRLCVQYAFAGDAVQPGAELLASLVALLSHPFDSVRRTASALLARLTGPLIAGDDRTLQQRNATLPVGRPAEQPDDWHVVQRLTPALAEHETLIRPFADQFSPKLIECNALPDVPEPIASAYLRLWNAILDLCADAPSELRSSYAAHLAAGQHVDRLLAALFRLMPVGRLMRTGVRIAFPSSAGATECTGQLACGTYARLLRLLPATVRKWWQNSAEPLKRFAERFTVTHVSGQLCQRELHGLRDAGLWQAPGQTSGAMRVTVHQSAREVIAAYVVDDVQMELTVTLPANYPLGAVAVTCANQLGGRLQSRALVMQLTIFLTHQNGSIANALWLWKTNLDRKFAGVQECYICYSVIHSDTCQLPRITCKKCRNMFHSGCLYKWFSTSNKSTCPICRNIF